MFLIINHNCFFFWIEKYLIGTDAEITCVIIFVYVYNLYFYLQIKGAIFFLNSTVKLTKAKKSQHDSVKPISTL